MQALKNRVGFALPLVVVFLVVLSFALAAGLAATAAEGSTSTAQRGQNRAYQVAEMGLQTLPREARQHLRASLATPVWLIRVLRRRGSRIAFSSRSPAVTRSSSRACCVRSKASRTRFLRSFSSARAASTRRASCAVTTRPRARAASA